MGRIIREAVYAPRSGDVLIVRGSVNDGVGTKTTQWGFQLTQQGIWVTGGDYALQLTGRIIGAHFPTAEDDRIAQQRRSIDLMLDHLKAHCPKLLGTGECEHIGPVAPIPSKEIL